MNNLNKNKYSSTASVLEDVKKVIPFSCQLYSPCQTLFGSNCITRKSLLANIGRNCLLCCSHCWHVLMPSIDPQCGRFGIIARNLIKLEVMSTMPLSSCLSLFLKNGDGANYPPTKYKVMQWPNVLLMLLRMIRVDMERFNQRFK